MKRIVLCIALQSLFMGEAAAQVNEGPVKAEKPNRWSVLFGLNQLTVLQGFNVEVNYRTDKWIIDYSHGINLDVTGKSLGGEYESQKINFKITHSAGIGIGYRITKRLM